MFKGKKIVGVIPARGGSKRLPRKNILNFCGKPLIAHTIEGARNSRYIDEVIVSTDDKNIAMVSRKYGASVPFKRPANLASKKAKTTDVVLHALKNLEKGGMFYDIAVLLQPTSPIRSTRDIDRAIEMLFKKRAHSIVSVCLADHHLFWANKLPKNGSMKDFIKKDTFFKRSQNLPVFYQLNGAIYAAYCKKLKKEKSFYGDRTFAYIMPRERSVDIDDEMDFKFAQFLYNERLR